MLRRVFIVPLILAMPHIISYGCSAIGYGVGSFVDSASRDTSWTSASGDWQMDAWDNTEIRLKDGSIVKGLYLNSSALPDSIYETEYEDRLKERHVAFPHFRDSVTVRTVPGTYAHLTSVGEFQGFDYNGETASTVITLGMADRITKLDIKNVKLLEIRDGNNWSGDRIRELLGDGSLLVNRSILLRTSGDDRHFSVYDIDSILVPTESNWKWVGLGAGAVVDVAAVIIIASNQKEEKKEPAQLGPAMNCSPTGY